uniref:Aerotolerance regulator N-terminal domain-containing protein n=1 Tax=candidate division WOR-3 bacterium TaxID=2052148 RepID=A0A7V4E496_UNCW3
MKFLAPSFLYLLPLAIIPLIIHFLSRFRLKKVDFSSIFFLIDLKKEKFNFYRLRDIFLLILRTFFIIFLILSISRPIFLSEKTSILKFLPQKAKPIILILDDSYSMEYDNNFEKAKTILKTIVKHLNRNSEITLFLTSKRKIVEKKKPVAISDTLIDNLKISYKKAYAQEILEDIKNFNSEVYFITDLQEKTYFFLKSFKSDFLINIIDLGKEEFENVGIVDFHWLAEKKGDLEFQIEVVNYTSQEKEIPVNIQVGDFKIRNFLILPPGKKKFQFTIPKMRERIFGKIYLEEENLKKDNLYYFVYQTKNRMPILFLYENEADIFYFKKLFTLIKDYQITYLPLKESKRISFSSYYLIFLINPSQIDQFLGWQLENYLKSGGKLILILGKDLKENKFQKIFATNGIWEDKGFVTIEEIAEEHPIFFGFKKEIFKEPKFYKIVNLQEKNLKVLMRFNNRLPFLLEDTLNNLMIFTSNFTSDFTDMPIKAIFLPLIFRTIEYLGIKEKNNFLVGETIFLSINLPKVKVVTPFGEFLEETFFQKGKRILKFCRTEEPGIYQIGEKIIAVNVWGEEGNLKKLTLKERENLKIIKEKPKLTSEITSLFIFLTFLTFLIEIILLIF